MTRVIETAGLGKRYRLGEGFYRYQTLRESLASVVRRRSGSSPAEIWALRDVDLAVDQGEVLGIIGRNGAGKTTLLRIIARIVAPTTGVSRTRGSIGTLLEVGTGFHPELTGRENIHLSGAVLGMRRRSITRRFGEIVEFAGLEPFLDTPLKRYSSGMYHRLAFSVAAHLEPDIVLVDEVLAVGDAEFQEKCIGKMSELGRAGRTVLFVSHDLGAITRLCQRAVSLDRGTITNDGPAPIVVESYLKSVAARVWRAPIEPEPGKPVQLLEVNMVDSAGAALEAPRRDKPLRISARFVVHERIPGLGVAFTIANAAGQRIIDEDVRDQHDFATLVEPGVREVVLTLPPALPAGDYVVGVWIGTEFDRFVDVEAIRFRLLPHPTDRLEAVERRRVVQPLVEWTVSSDPRPTVLDVR
jgi:ABC-type polysaccharide/polyol phosphate transport system ATPase subunit